MHHHPFYLIYALLYAFQYTFMNVGFIILAFVISLVIAIAWANAISKMHKNHPDYKGEDFLNHDNENNINTNMR